MHLFFVCACARVRVRTCLLIILEQTQSPAPRPGACAVRDGVFSSLSYVAEAADCERTEEYQSTRR